MTASRSDGAALAVHWVGRVLAAASLAAAVALTPQAFAQSRVQGQTGAPLQLVPPQGSGTGAASPDRAGTDRGEAGQAGTDPAAAEKTGVEVLSLSQFDVDGLGLLDPDQSGLGPAPWADTQRDTAVALLRLLPLDVASPTLLALGERLLLANAPPPGGVAAGSASFLDLRLQRLFDWGLASEVQRILARLPHSRQSETTFRLSVQALLVDGRDEAACDLVRREIVAYSSQDFWAKALVYCQIWSGEVEQAYLGLDLLRETGMADDPLFTTLAHRFAGAEVAIEDDTQASVLNFAMLNHLKLPISQGFAAKAPRALWPVLAASDKLDPLERASLSEAALGAGLIKPETLAAAYRAIPFTPDERAGALTSAKALDGVLGRALLFQAAEAQSLVAARGEVLKGLVALARSERRTGVVLPVIAPLLRDLRPRTDLAGFAETAARSFYILGDVELARGWVRLIERDATSSATAQAALLRLWPLARLRGQAKPLPDDSLSTWAGQRLPDAGAETEGPVATPRQIYLLFAAFRALELPGDSSVTMLPGWAETEEPLAVSYPLLMAIDDAGRAGRKGEGLLLSLVSVGGRQWDQVAVIEAAALLDLMQGLGLADEARQLAMEIVLANGL